MTSDMRDSSLVIFGLDVGDPEVIRRLLATVHNLQSVGHGGMHRYNNMDHSMITGMSAVGSLLRENPEL